MRFTEKLDFVLIAPRFAIQGLVQSDNASF